MAKLGYIIFNVDGNKKGSLSNSVDEKIGSLSNSVDEKIGSLSNSVDEKISYNLI
ncbi:hypothetical protein [Peptostreptococcus russellii]|uniref:hypothetical protein n=1 Tax=Peptostreptococcus russellii TaxID=215200 RepID=UPI002942DC35|nr:hypothetical protein [Peptostreptococcus russellii]